MGMRNRAGTLDLTSSGDGLVAISAGPRRPLRSKSLKALNRKVRRGCAKAKIRTEFGMKMLIV
jgi:hypothetical protein